MRRPGNRKRVHAVPVLEQVRLHGTVLATAPAHDTVVASVRLPVLITELVELMLTLSPVDLTRFLQLVEVACVSHASVVEGHRCLLRVSTMRILVAGHGLLIGHVALFAELHVSWQAVQDLELIHRPIESG